MPTITRQLSAEEFTAWDGLVASSPQAGLFHTTAWNQMLYETAPQGQEWTLLVCEKEGVLLGGISLHYWRSGLKIQVPIPLFGYNGPILGNAIHYQEHYKTVPGYEVIQELVKNISSVSNQVMVKNQPEIWDIRAYVFNGWKIDTDYTHILPFLQPDDIWAKIDSAVQEQISASQYSINTDIADTQIQKFSLYVSQNADPTCPPQEKQVEVLKNRIHWMKEKQVCKLVTVTDKSGTELAIALFALSRENRTIYLCKIIPLVKGIEGDILPSLIWQSYLSFGAGFERMDLGNSTNMSISKIKDRLGCNLTPTFIAKYFKS